MCGFASNLQTFVCSIQHVVTDGLAGIHAPQHLGVLDHDRAVGRLAAVGLVVGSLLVLRDTANKQPIDPEKMKRIKARQAELEAQEKKRD